MSKEEQVGKLAEEIWGESCAGYLTLDDVKRVINKAINYGYCLAALEVAEEDAGRSARA